MMTDEQILELAKNCEFDFSIKWRLKGGESSNQMYWECWEQQLLKFALAIHEDGYNKGYEECSFDMGDENV
jgi:hypothetical protein